MKINLLSSKTVHLAEMRRAFKRVALLFTATLCIAGVMIYWSLVSLNSIKEAAELLEPQAMLAYRTSKRADVMMQKTVHLEQNLKLYEASKAHNLAYIQLYQDVLRHCPTYFRLTSLVAHPKDETDSLVTMKGTLKTYQQYADLMLSLMQVPGVERVYRSEWESHEQYVPSLTEEDREGLPIRPGEVPLPSQPFSRFEANIERANQPLPNYFALIPDEAKLKKGEPIKPKPGESEIEIYLLIKDRSLQSPNPKLTLSGMNEAKKTLKRSSVERRRL